MAEHFGGMGGLLDGREMNTEDKFEVAVNKALGDEIRTSDDAAKAMWSALANVDWYHPETGSSASYSFRAAGDLIAAIRGRGMYMDWYCSGPYAEVSDHIARAMKKEGWIADTMPSICDEPGCLEFVSRGTPTDEGYRHTCSEHGRAIDKRKRAQQAARDAGTGEGGNQEPKPMAGRKSYGNLRGSGEGDQEAD